jgi:hypothetical protein
VALVARLFHVAGVMPCNTHLIVPKLCPLIAKPTAHSAAAVEHVIEVTWVVVPPATYSHESLCVVLCGAFRA